MPREQNFINDGIILSDLLLAGANVKNIILAWPAAHLFSYRKIKHV
jgi:hypothetical protein